MNDKKILIVDFDAESLIALSNLVYEEGFQAETATDGLSAYEKFRSGNFDLVILEPMLPKLHGFELCKRIINNPAKKVPIIIVTAIYREPSCRHEALNVNGAAAFFTKPYNREELRAKMLQLLIERQEQAPLKAEAPAVVAPQAQPPTRPATPPPAPAPLHAAAAPKGYDLDLRQILGAKPVAKEPRTTKSSADIEKELQDAVSSLVSPLKKKDVRPPTKPPEAPPTKETPRVTAESREAREQTDRDIDVLLKDAIGGIITPAKKKKPDISILAKPAPEVPRALPSEPAVKPAPAVEKRVGPALPDRVTVAKEIKQNLPFQAGKPNNVPRPPSRMNFERQAAPFDIDRTLIEIDKIPLDVVKPAPGEDRLADKAPSYEKKRELFDEYSEPVRKKTSFAIIGAVAGVLLIATSAAFFVLKPKKPGAPASGTVSSAQAVLTAETGLRGSDTKPYPDAQEAELKPEPKRTVVKKVEDPPVDIGAPIQPAVPSEGAPVQIQDQPIQTAAAAPKGETEAGAKPGGQGESPQPMSEPAAAGAEKSPSQPPPKAKEGALYPLDQVDVSPVLIKRVDPKYPPLAMRSGVGGMVTVNVLISDKGEVLRTEILKGVKDGFGIEGAAETAIRQWKFSPALKDGVSVRVWKSFDINFRPNPKLS
jgi:TonB family protein